MASFWGVLFRYTVCIFFVDACRRTYTHICIVLFCLYTSPCGKPTAHYQPKTSQAFGPETPSSCAPPYWSYKPLEAWSRFAISERPQWNSSAPQPGELKSMNHGLSECCACHTKIWDAHIYVYQYIHLHVITKFSKLFMCKRNLNIYIYTFNIYFPWLHSLLHQDQFEKIRS